MTDTKPINGAQNVQVNPLEVARVALQFLQRCTLQPAERDAYGTVEQMLTLIARGELMVTQFPSGQTQPIDDGKKPATN